jgi:hypothetical protein
VEQKPQIDFDVFLLLVGKLNYTWTNTESLLIHIIAGLCGIDKETAMVVFLTLNTTRARLDLVERLCKLDRIDESVRDRILSLTQGLQKQSALRNRYSHCIYAFDPDSGNARTILMRIADRKDKLVVGQVNQLNGAAAEDIEAAISDIGRINRDIWKVIADYGYPA